MRRALQVLGRENAQSGLGGVRRLLGLAWPERRFLGGAMVAVGVSTATNLAFPAGLGKLIDVATGSNPDALFGYGIDEISAGLLGLFVVGGVSTFARSSLLQVAGERVVRRLRQDLYSSLLRQPMEFYDRVPVGEVVNRLSTDTMVISKSVTEQLSVGLRRTMEGIGAVGLLVHLSPALTGSMLMAIPPASILAVLFGRYIKGKNKQLMTDVAATSEVAEERLNAISTIRSFLAEEREDARYKGRVQSVYKTAVQLALAQASFFGVSQVLMSTAVLSVLWRGSGMVDEGVMTVGDLSSFLLYSVYTAVSLAGASQFYTNLMSGVGASSRVFQLIGQTTPPPQGTVELRKGAARSIEFRDVNFVYPTRPDAPILKHCNFKITPGDSVAIVGSSGSGKSSILRLLLQFYEQQSGKVLVDGHELSTIKDFGRQVAFVSQEVTLFRDTVLENLRYGKPDASLEDVVAAAKLANAHSFIKELPQGYETPIRGDSLSGGQRQRVGIARALLLDPSLLLLDEVSSAQDSRGEKLLNDALVGIKAAGGKTMLTVTHRLSTARLADKIIVIDQGHVAESGTHMQLMRTQGIYHGLVQAQALQDKT